MTFTLRPSIKLTTAYEYGGILTSPIQSEQNQ